MKTRETESVVRAHINKHHSKYGILKGCNQSGKKHPCIRVLSSIRIAKKFSRNCYLFSHEKKKKFLGTYSS